MKHQRGYTIIELLFSFWGILILVFGIGWVMNIIDLFGMIHEPAGLMMILRAIGIFVFPLGGVLGYL